MPYSVVAGLWKHYFGWPPGLPMPAQSFTVHSECRSSIVHWSWSLSLTATLASFYWLWALELIKFKLAVIVYQTFHGTAPHCLSDLLRYITDLLMRNWLLSSTSRLLYVCPARLVTVDYCWNMALEQPTWGCLLLVCLVIDNILSKTYSCNHAYTRTPI